MFGNLDYDRLFFGRKAAIVLGVAATLALWGVVAHFVDFKPAHPSQMATVVLVVCALATMIGAICLFGAMWMYWLKCDNSSKRSRTIWFFVLLLGLLSGAPQVLYYLAVYLPAVRNRHRGVEGRKSGSGVKEWKRSGVFKVLGWVLLTGWLLFVFVPVAELAFSRPLIHFPRAIAENFKLIHLSLIAGTAIYIVMLLFRIGMRRTTR